MEADVSYRRSLAELTAQLDNLIALPCSEKLGIRVVSYSLYPSPWRESLSDGYSHIEIRFHAHPNYTTVYDVLGYCVYCDSSNSFNEIGVSHVLFLSSERFSPELHCPHFDFPSLSVRSAL